MRILTMDSRRFHAQTDIQEPFAKKTLQIYEWAGQKLGLSPRVKLQ